MMVLAPLLPEAACAPAASSEVETPIEGAQAWRIHP